MSSGWKDNIGRCFGSQDLNFGIHPVDLERSAELLCEVVKEGVLFDELEAEVRKYLKQKLLEKFQISEINNSMQDHIDKEIERVNNLFGHWLNN